MSDPTVPEANDPLSPAERADRIAAAEWEWTRITNAENPRSAPDMLVGHTQDPSPYVRSAAAGNPSTPSDALEALAADEQELPHIRSAARANLDSPSRTVPPAPAEKPARAGRRSLNSFMDQLVNPDPSKGGRIIRAMGRAEASLHARTPAGKAEAASRKVMLNQLNSTREAVRKAAERRDAGDPNWEESLPPSEGRGI